MIAIPQWIKDIRLEGYKNIFEMLPQNTQLHGPETFCGDWNAHTIILAKDCAPTRIFEKRIKENHPNPYSHDPKLPTNRNMAKVLKEIGIDLPTDNSKAKTCGVIYMNSYFLLRDDGEFSGALPNQKECKELSFKVFEFALENLPQARRIICMGKDAYDFACAYFNLQGEWRKNLNERHYLHADGYIIIPSSHLGSRGVNNRLQKSSYKECLAKITEDWQAAFNANTSPAFPAHSQSPAYGQG